MDSSIMLSRCFRQLLKPGTVQLQPAKMGVVRPLPIGPGHEVNPTIPLVDSHDTVYRESSFGESSDKRTIDAIKIEMVPSVSTR